MNLIKWLSISDRHTKMYLDRSLAPLCLNSSQHMYVLKICETPGVTQDQFIHFFYLHPSNVTRTLSALEKAGFLRRERNPEDQRTCRLFPPGGPWRPGPRSSPCCAGGRSRSWNPFPRRSGRYF